MEKILIRVYDKLYEKSSLNFRIFFTHFQERLAFGNVQKHPKLCELRFAPSRNYDCLFLIPSMVDINWLFVIIKSGVKVNFKFLS